jgi:hypothetical protein
VCLQPGSVSLCVEHIFAQRGCVNGAFDFKDPECALQCKSGASLCSQTAQSNQHCQPRTQGSAPVAKRIKLLSAWAVSVGSLAHVPCCCWGHCYCSVLPPLSLSWPCSQRCSGK